MGKWSCSATFSWKRYQIEVNSEHHAQVALPVGEITPSTNGIETGRGPGQSGRLWREDSCPSPELEPDTLVIKLVAYSRCCLRYLRFGCLWHSATRILSVNRASKLSEFPCWCWILSLKQEGKQTLWSTFQGRSLRKKSCSELIY